LKHSSTPAVFLCGEPVGATDDVTNVSTDRVFDAADDECEVRPGVTKGGIRQDTSQEESPEFIVMAWAIPNPGQVGLFWSSDAVVEEGEGFEEGIPFNGWIRRGSYERPKDLSEIVGKGEEPGREGDLIPLECPDGGVVIHEVAAFLGHANGKESRLRRVAQETAWIVVMMLFTGGEVGDPIGDLPDDGPEELVRLGRMQESRGFVEESVEIEFLDDLRHGVQGSHGGFDYWRRGHLMGRDFLQNVFTEPRADPFESRHE
jgi:hypothetical protein